MQSIIQQRNEINSFNLVIWGQLKCLICGNALLLYWMSRLYLFHMYYFPSLVSFKSY